MLFAWSVELIFIPTPFAEVVVPNVTLSPDCNCTTPPSNAITPFVIKSESPSILNDESLPNNEPFTSPVTGPVCVPAVLPVTLPVTSPVRFAVTVPAFAFTTTVELFDTTLPVNEAASISPVATIPLVCTVLQAALGVPKSLVLEASGVMFEGTLKYCDDNVVST